MLTQLVESRLEDLKGDAEGQSASFATVTEVTERSVTDHRRQRCVFTLTSTLWSPDEPDSQEVLQVVEKNIFDLEVLLHPDGARTAGRHDEPRSVQADAGQPVVGIDTVGERHLGS